MTRPVTLVCSIDTEGDHWEARSEPEPVANIRQIPRLQAFLRSLGVRPTYLVTWQVATDPWSSGLVRELHASGEAEIGAHLHPWNSPPVVEAFEPRNTMLCNLPEPLQEQKLARLTDAIATSRGAPPTTFRAGRWGFGHGTVAALVACGYEVDTSVMPYTSWAQYHGPVFDGAPVGMYRLGTRGDVRVPDPDGEVVEVPFSVGFSRRPFGLVAAASALLQRPPLRQLRAPGIAWRLGLVRRLPLSPETTSARDMLRLARNLLDEGLPFVHMMWHSQSLTSGLSPFVRTATELDRFYAAIRDFVEGLAGFADVTCATVGEAAARHGPRRATSPAPARAVSA